MKTATERGRRGGEKERVVWIVVGEGVGDGEAEEEWEKERLRLIWRHVRRGLFRT